MSSFCQTLVDSGSGLRCTEPEDQLGSIHNLVQLLRPGFHTNLAGHHICSQLVASASFFTLFELCVGGFQSAPLHALPFAALPALDALLNLLSLGPINPFTCSALCLSWGSPGTLTPPPSSNVIPCNHSNAYFSHPMQGGNNCMLKNSDGALIGSGRCRRQVTDMIQ